MALEPLRRDRRSPTVAPDGAIILLHWSRAAGGGREQALDWSPLPTAGSTPLRLVPHPTNPAAGLHRLEASVACEDGRLVLDFSTEGDAGAVRWPSAAAPVRTDGLWRHTCFEAFLRDSRGPGYCEFNLSPSTEWAAYHFTDYRHGMRPLDLERTPRICAAIEPGQARICADIALDAVEATLAGAGSEGSTRLLLGLSAVIEDEAGALSYWALRHPAERPDFHRPEGFVVEIAAVIGRGQA